MKAASLVDKLFEVSRNGPPPGGWKDSDKVPAKHRSLHNPARQGELAAKRDNLGPDPEHTGSLNTVIGALIEVGGSQESISIQKLRGLLKNLSRRELDDLYNKLFAEQHANDWK